MLRKIAEAAKGFSGNQSRFYSFSVLFNFKINPMIPRQLILLMLIPMSVSAQQVLFEAPQGLEEYRLTLGTQIHRTASVSLGDIDGDGDLDIITANGRHWPEENMVFLNLRGIFRIAYPFGDERSTSYACELADLDGDGDLDIAEGNDMAPSKIYLNDGKGKFSFHGYFGAISPTRNLKITDIDLDGDMDILVANRGSANLVCYNDGKGNFPRSEPLGESTSTIDIEVADLNRDQFPDVILANRDDQPNQILINNRKGGFESPVFFGGAVDSRSVAVADFDKDGFPDIAMGNLNAENLVYFGDDRLDFSRTVAFGKKGEMAFAVAVEDFNRDGSPDIICGNNGDPLTLYLNTGDGHFERQSVGREGYKTYDIVAGDINGDGLPDIILANSHELSFYIRNRYKSGKE